MYMNYSIIYLLFSIYFYRTALQFLFKATELARSFNYYDGGLSHTWMTFYQAQLTDDGVALNEWLDISLFVSLSLSLCLCLCLCLSLSLFLSVSVSFLLCLSVCLSLSLSFIVSVSVSLFVVSPFCLPLFLSLYLSLPLSVSLPLSIHHSTLLLTITRYMYLLLLLLLGGYKVLYSPSVLIPLYTMISVASLIGHYCKYMYINM